MSIINSHNVDLTDIFVNNTGNVYSSCENTLELLEFFGLGAII